MLCIDTKLQINIKYSIETILLFGTLAEMLYLCSRNEDEGKVEAIPRRNHLPTE